jgi:hypothetical protein
LNNVLRVIGNGNLALAVSERTGTVTELGKEVWDSGLSQSLEKCIPKIDAIVSAIDKVAKVSPVVVEEITL